MKKSILLFSTVLTAFSLTAVGFMNWNGSSEHIKNEKHSENSDGEKTMTCQPAPAPDFVYDVASRFLMTITKEDLQKAKTILDIIPQEEKDRFKVDSYQSVKVTILEDYHQTDNFAIGANEVLTPTQIKLIKTINYSANFSIYADFYQKNPKTGHVEGNYFSPHFTVVPEKHTAYLDGAEAFVDYLKKGSKTEVAIVKEENLKSGKIYFTISTNGTISNVELSQSSGYPSIDEKMLELIKNAPGKWQPAETAQGEQVEQTLVFSFGTMGC